MRPTDEHQAGTTRPNFMASSPRPAGGEDNILARLERNGKRDGSGTTWKHARLAWSGLISVLVIGLIGVLASLASDNLTLHRRPMLIEAKALAPAQEAASAALPAKASGAPQPGATPTSPMLAVAVTEPPPARDMVKTDAPSEVPALVLLKSPASAPQPVEPLMGAAKEDASAPSPRSLAPPRRVAHRHTAKNDKNKAAPSRSLAATKTRAITAASTARVTPAAIDSDVALLSAIIIHSSRHAGERAQQEAARCGAGKKCAPSHDRLSPNAFDAL